MCSAGEIKEGGALTFLAAALKASLCEMSGLPALMRWISSLSAFPSPQKHQNKEKSKRKGIRQISGSGRSKRRRRRRHPHYLRHHQCIICYQHVSLTSLSLSSSNSEREREKAKENKVSLRLQRPHLCSSAAPVPTPGPGRLPACHRSGNGIAVRVRPRTCTPHAPASLLIRKCTGSSYLLDEAVVRRRHSLPLLRSCRENQSQDIC